MTTIDEEETSQDSKSKDVLFGHNLMTTLKEGQFFGEVALLSEVSSVIRRRARRRTDDRTPVCMFAERQAYGHGRDANGLRIHHPGQGGCFE